MSEVKNPPPAGWYPYGNQQRWWDGTGWTEHYAPAQQVVVQTGKTYKTSHGFHLVMTILTAGLWALFVWLPVGLYNSARNGR